MANLVTIPSGLLQTKVRQVVRLVGAQTFDYTPDERCNGYLVQLLAGGGAGGSADGNTSNASVTGGGASGEYAEKTYMRARGGLESLTYPITITLGAAGAPGAAGQVVGGTAADSSFGSEFTVKGGIGGKSGVAGTSGTYAEGGLPGGSGTGTADLRITGAAGEDGRRWSGTLTRVGRGGNAPGPFGGCGGAGNATMDQNGLPGGYGAGGSGGAANSTTDRQGGAGGDPVCIIWEFFP